MKIYGFFKAKPNLSAYRYWLFGWNKFYPEGGSTGIRAASNNLEELQDYVSGKSDKKWYFDYHEIFDSEERKFL